MKECKKCHIQKNLTEFYKIQDRWTWNICKQCTRDRTHDYWENGRGKEVDKKRAQKPKRKEWQRKFSASQRIKWKKKREARYKFWNSFKRGRIKKLPCEKCKTEELVEAHHPDYNKPFEVMWLCSLHHKEWHKYNKAILN